MKKQLLILTCEYSEKRLENSLKNLSEKLIFKVQPEDIGLRLDKYLSGLEEISSRNYAQNLIEKKLVFVNSKVAKASLQLKENQIIEIILPELVATELVPYELALDIVYEDSDLLVVNKPSGLVVHPAAGHQQDTLVNALLFHTKDLSMKNELRPGIVHRIDKETSGLLVVAKNDQAHEKLSQQFKDKTTHRIYFALIEGNLPKASGVCRSYLTRHPVDRKKYASIKENNKIINALRDDVSTGKWAITHFTKLAQHANMSYVKLQLETGRTHQIRVHMSELGHPLVGDTLYGYSVKKKKELSINRFYLHAAELGFTHPRTNEKLIFKVNWPVEDLKKLKELGFSCDQISE